MFRTRLRTETSMLPAGRLPRFFLVTFLLAVPGAAGAEQEAPITMRDGVPHVANPADPAGGQVTVELEELWRLGGYSDDDNEFFGVISQCREDAEGNLYLLDSQLSEVKVFSPEGEYLRTIGRQGEGPGEFRNSNDLFLGFGNVVGVVQVWPGKIVRLTTDGEPLDNFPLPSVEGGGFQLVFSTRALEDRVVIAGQQQRSVEGKQVAIVYLKAFDSEGNELAHYHQETQETRFGSMEFDEKSFTSFQQRWALAPDGRVFAALSFDDYAIHVWRPDGTLDRVIEREFEPLQRTDRQKDRFQRMFDGITRWNPNSTFQVSPTHQAISRLFAREDGTLWVLSSRGVYDRPEGTLAVFDVFDRDGRFAEQVRLDGPGDPEGDGIYLSGDRLYLATSQWSAMMGSLGIDTAEEDPDPVSVIGYRMNGMEAAGRP
jgi:hypothetical protein